MTAETKKSANLQWQMLAGFLIGLVAEQNTVLHFALSEVTDRSKRDLP